jgi:hypothetical protein
VLWDVDPNDWQTIACTIAGRNLSHAEWHTYLPNLHYQRTCPLVRPGSLPSSMPFRWDTCDRGTEQWYGSTELGCRAGRCTAQTLSALAPLFAQLVCADRELVDWAAGAGSRVVDDRLATPAVATARGQRLSAISTMVAPGNARTARTVT